MLKMQINDLKKFTKKVYLINCFQVLPPPAPQRVFYFLKIGLINNRSVAVDKYINYKLRFV